MTTTLRRSKTYQSLILRQLIRAGLDGSVDARHVEAQMLEANGGCIDFLPADQWQVELAQAIAAVRADPLTSERLAQLHGL
jgi:hypothetical protein